MGRSLDHSVPKPKVVAISPPSPPPPPLTFRHPHSTSHLFYRLSSLFLVSKRRPPLPTLITLLALTLLLLAFLLDSAVFLQLTSTFAAPLHLVSRQATEVYYSLAMSTVKPPSKKEVGNAGWTLIHSIAANYPHQPTESEKRHAKAFLRSIGKLYPCKKCRHHFDKYLSTTPPDLSSRDQFVLWACSAHNAVNKRNGKQEFPCRMKNLDARWGDCGCKLKQK